MHMTRECQKKRSRERGYSLPELLIVIALIGLFVLFGGPAMADGYRAYKVRSIANNVTVDLRAMRYNAVSKRATQTMTLNNQNHATAPNRYSYSNFQGDPITVTLEPPVNIETTSAATINFNIYGSTGVSGSQTVVVSGPINGSRNDRYTITVSPTGTISSAYSTF
jgi:prepilin-type N-terminal cleavage/methylation domain-containing protein